MDNDLFSPSETPDGSAFDQSRPLVDPNKNYLEELVGQGRKFDTVEELARGKFESDLMIATLLREKREALEELNKRATVEDLLAKLGQNKERSVANPLDGSNQNQIGSGHDVSNGTSSLNLEEIKAALKEDLRKEAEQQAKNQNVAIATEKLREMFGDQAASVLQRKAQELGVTTAYLRDIAATSPKLFFSTIGEAPRGEAFVTPPNTRVNTQGLPPSKNYGDHKPNSYYEKLKASDKKKYMSPEITKQMHRDMIALGDRYFD